MRTFKLAAIAAVAISAAAAGGQVRRDAYGYPYTPTYSSYPVSNPPTALRGQCGTMSIRAVSFLGRCCSAYGAHVVFDEPVLFVFGLLHRRPLRRRTAVRPTGQLPERLLSGPNGSCGSVPNGGCCANGRCGTCPAGSLPIGELFGQLSERPMHARAATAISAARRTMTLPVRFTAARLCPAGPAVFAGELVERPALSPQL